MHLDFDVPQAVDPSIEEHALASILKWPSSLQGILRESHLQPYHFFTKKHRQLCEVILNLHTNGTPPTVELVESHLPADYDDRFPSYLRAFDVSGSDGIHYAKRTVELYEWREKRQAAIDCIQAVANRNSDGFVEATSKLTVSEVLDFDYRSPDRLADEFKEFMDEEDQVTISLPFPTLNEALGGGLRKRQMSILGGWSSHGKSVIIDQILAHASLQGFKVHLYMNEMSHEERVARLICRQTGIKYQKLMRKDLTVKEYEACVQVLDNGLPFSITPCAGWSIHQLTYDIRNRNYDLIGVDILHLFDYDSENELARISRFLNRVAKQANCHIIATVHLNEFRVSDSIRPRPVTRDIRGSGMLKNDADNVLMIYREQDPSTGDPTTPASLYLSKVRNGSLGSESLFFDPSHITFRESRSRRTARSDGKTEGEQGQVLDFRR